MYTKTSWVARVGTALNRFLKTNESAGSVELTNDPTGVTTAGTPFTVANMNKIEQGIYDAHVTADANASNLSANVNQDVKTTASPTFGSIPFIYIPSPAILSNVTLTPTNITDITTDGTNLISVNNITGMIQIHDGITDTVLSSFSAPTSLTAGLAFDGTNLLSLGYVTDRYWIYKHDGISSTILASYAPPAQYISGITFDGTNVILCGTSPDLIYIQDGVSATTLSSFASPTDRADSLTFDGTNLIVGDSYNGRIYILDKVTKVILYIFPFPTNLEAKNKVDSIAFDGEHLLTLQATEKILSIHKRIGCFHG